MTLAYSPLIILLAPLAAGAVIGLAGDRIGEKVYRVGVLADLLALVLSLRILYDVVTGGPQYLDIAPFAGAGLGFAQVALHIDRLAAVMMVHITAISTVIHLFSSRYMQQERGYMRFHSLLALTTFALLGMVASATLLMLFVFWQLLSWLLSFLSYNYSHPPTVRGSFRTFIMQRFGDVAFLLGIVLARVLYGTLDIQQLFLRAADVHSAGLPDWGLPLSGTTAVTLLIFVGAMSKSAQIPLHMWLPDSLYAPTPVHALLHAGIINAGGFLLARLAPLYDFSPATLHLVFVVGLITALLGSSMMLIQNDIKKTLGYSTIGQMGFMIMECGLGAFGLAIFHLIAHGIFKGTIFLNCGSVIHAARLEPRSPPKNENADAAAFSSLTWMTGFITTLILPLFILLAGHGVLQIPLRDSQGAVIFLFFGWVTSSQAILTLYRLRAVASWKVAAAMLLTLFLVVVTYLLAAESFTYFLFPRPGEAARHFDAGALPGPVFDFLVSAAALLIVFSWILIYARAHGRSIRMPNWVNALQIHFYLLLMNRLYLDALAFALGRRFKRVARVLNTSRLFSCAAGMAAVIAALAALSWRVDFVVFDFARLLIAAVLLPLFPVHGIYIAAVTRARGIAALSPAILLPLAGLYATSHVILELSPQLLTAAGTLALFGALYGAIKALAESRMVPLVAHASLSLYSVLWWHLAETRTLSLQAAAYFTAVLLVTSGLLLAWSHLRKRHGDAAPDHLSGLARPMPRFALLVSLLVMAGVGLPPFGLFSGFAAMLLHLSNGFSWTLVVIVTAWFAASFYFFRMMQRLLFGPCRGDVPYEDLRNGEALPLLAILALLIAVGLLPLDGFQQGSPTPTVTVEMRP